MVRLEMQCIGYTIYRRLYESSGVSAVFKGQIYTFQIIVLHMNEIDIRGKRGFI